MHGHWSTEIEFGCYTMPIRNYTEAYTEPLRRTVVRYATTNRKATAIIAELGGSSSDIGVRILVHEHWGTDIGAGTLEHGHWSTDIGARTLEEGHWSLEFGAWTLEHLHCWSYI